MGACLVRNDFDHDRSVLKRTSPNHPKSTRTGATPVNRKLAILLTTVGFGSILLTGCGSPAAEVSSSPSAATTPTATAAEFTQVTSTRMIDEAGENFPEGSMFDCPSELPIAVGSTQPCTLTFSDSTVITYNVTMATVDGAVYTLDIKKVADTANSSAPTGEAANDPAFISPAANVTENAMQVLIDLGNDASDLAGFDCPNDLNVAVGAYAECAITQTDGDSVTTYPTTFYVMSVDGDKYVLEIGDDIVAE